MIKSPFPVVYVGVGSYRGGGAFGPAEFPHWDLFTLRDGAAALRVAGRTFRLAAGDAVLIPPDHRFEGTAGPAGATLWVVHFRASVRTVAAAGLRVDGRIRRIAGALGGDFEKLVAARLLELWQGSKGRPSPAADSLAGYLLVAVAQRARRPSVPSGRRRQFEQLLEDCAGESPALSGVARLAGRAGFSGSHLRAEFRRLFARSPAALLRDRRLREAARLLRETRLPIKEIAVRTGYGEVSAFHRAFQRHHGKTPAAYRNGSLPAV